MAIVSYTSVTSVTRLNSFLVKYLSKEYERALCANTFLLSRLHTALWAYSFLKRESNVGL